MAKFYTELNATLREFIAAQRIFFNASAPTRAASTSRPKVSTRYASSATRASGTST